MSKKRPVGPTSLLPSNLHLDKRYHPIHTTTTKVKIAKKTKKVLRTTKRKKHLQSLKKSKQTESYKQSCIEAGLKRKSDPKWREVTRKANEELRSKPGFAKIQKKINKALAKVRKTKQYKKNHKKGVIEREKNKAYHEKKKEGTIQAVGIQVQAGTKGVFRTAVDAAKAWGWFGKNGYPNSERVRHRCKSKSFPDWFIISKGKQDENKKNI